MSKHKLPADRKMQILDAAIKLAHIHGYQNISREAISDKCGVSPALISHYLGTMKSLRRYVVGEALKRNDLRVIGQALVAKDKRALGAPESVRRAALEFVMGV